MAHRSNFFWGFPSEILASILSEGFGEEPDLVYLWTTLRNVDHRFRYEVEEFVRRTHLKRSFIAYRLDHHINSVVRLSHEPELWLRFKDVDPCEPSTAVFLIDPEMSSSLNSVAALSSLQARLRKHPPDDWSSPPHMLSVQRYVNDTELCGFQLSIKDAKQGLFEVRLDWKATLSKLLIEDKLRQTFSRRWLQEKRAKLSGLLEHPLHVLLRNIHHTVRLHQMSHRTAYDDSFGRARGIRIAKQTGDSRPETPIPIATGKFDQLVDHICRMNQFTFDI